MNNGKIKEIKTSMKMVMNKSTLIKFVGPLLVIAVGIGANSLLHQSKPEPEKKEKVARALSVFVEPVQQASVTLTVNTEGEVRARTEIDIVSQVAGRVVAVTGEFTEGGKVEPGHTLIFIEAADYQLALTQAEVRVAEAEVKVQQALATADVARKQLRHDSSASPLALKKPQLAQAKALLKAAGADLQQARLNLSRTKISLPFSGRMTKTLVDVGQYITPGTRLGEAFATDIVEIRLALTDSQLASLDLPIGYIAAEGQGRKVSVSAKVAGRQQHWEARLVRLDASIDSQTRMLYGMAEVIDPYGENVSEHQMPLAVGLYVQAEIEGREVDEAYLISRQALRAGHLVYVVNDSGHLEVREVDVVHSSAKEAVISRGLSEGEQVIVSSIRNPIHGMALTAMVSEKELSEKMAFEGSAQGKIDEKEPALKEPETKGSSETEEGG